MYINKLNFFTTNAEFNGESFKAQNENTPIRNLSNYVRRYTVICTHIFDFCKPRPIQITYD